MGQAVKYAVLGVALVAVIALAGSIISQLNPDSALSSFASSVSSFLSNVGNVLHSVRGALNYVLGAPMVSIAIFFWVSIPIARLAFRVVVMVYRFINQ